MTYHRSANRNRTSCRDCPLRACDLFEPFSSETLKFMEKFKVGELKIDAGTPLLMEGHGSPQLFTALEGMGLRYKTLESGERQVVNFIFPGDFIGMQAAILGEMKHSVEATTAMKLCVFDRNEIWKLFRSEPERAFSLTWLASAEESFLAEALTTVGNQAAIGRVAWALAKMHRRLTRLNLNTGKSVPMPYKQQDVADAVGLSLVHTNKTLARLRERQLASWSDGQLVIANIQALDSLTGLEPDEETRRPLM